MGRVLPGSSMLFLCDMQEKFRHVVYFRQIVSVAARMLKVQPCSLGPRSRPHASSLRPGVQAAAPFGLRPALLRPHARWPGC